MLCTDVFAPVTHACDITKVYHCLKSALMSAPLMWLCMSCIQNSGGAQHPSLNLQAFECVSKGMCL